MIVQNAPKSKILLYLCSCSVFLFHAFYTFTFPLNFGGDASIYYTMILDKHSSLLMAPGYPFLVMLPYHWIRGLISKIAAIPEDLAFTPWWQTSTIRMDLIGSKIIDGDFSWISVFQDHGFIAFQHGVALLSLFCGFLLARRYFREDSLSMYSSPT